MRHRRRPVIVLAYLLGLWLGTLQGHDGAPLWVPVPATFVGLIFWLVGF